MEETEKKDDLLPLWVGPEANKTEDEKFMETHPIFVEPPFEAQRKKAQCVDDLPMIPKGSRIVATRNEFVQRSAIYIPDTAQVKPTTGKIVGIGPDVPEGLVRLGETIVFGLYSGIEMNIVNGKGEVTTYLMLTPDEIAAELIVDPSKVSKR